MNRLKILSVGFILTTSLINAQDLETAKKLIDAEQFEKAKKTLKNLVTTTPDAGKNYFVLGNVYLSQKVQDSAAIYFNKGLTAKKDAQFNSIGLGQIELENENAAAAKALFDKVAMGARKKDFEELLYIGRAYMNSVKPDYKSALVYLNKAKEIAPNDAQVFLSLGDAYYGDSNQNEAFSAYRNAYDADNSVLRAKLQLGRITKQSRAFKEAKEAFEKIIATNPNYGPAYRELAETYGDWGLIDRTKTEEYNKTALTYYDKYMTLTDYSLDSRMRHADFLMLTKDYKALEVEANEMQKLSKVNPRILRYLGYSGYQNGNIDGSIKALTEFVSNPKSKVIGRDYFYLGLSKTKKAITVTTAADGAKTATVDAELFKSGVADLRKGVEIDPYMANELNDFGKIYFESGKYREAAAIYEIAVLNPNSSNFKFDNNYLGVALYNDQKKLDPAKVDPAIVEKAITGLNNVTNLAPNYQDAYIYKARLNNLLPETDALKTKTLGFYEDYIRVITAKGEAETSKSSSKTKLKEAHNYVAFYYLKTDKVKAKENLDKVLAIDPADEQALANMKFVK